MIAKRWLSKMLSIKNYDTNYVPETKACLIRIPINTLKILRRKESNILVLRELPLFRLYLFTWLINLSAGVRAWLCVTMFYYMLGTKWRGTFTPIKCSTFSLFIHSHRNIYLWIALVSIDETVISIYYIDKVSLFIWNASGISSGDSFGCYEHICIPLLVFANKDTTIYIIYQSLHLNNSLCIGTSFQLKIC